MSDLQKEFMEQAEMLKNINFSKPAAYFKAARKLYLPLQEGTANAETFFDYTLAVFEETGKPEGDPDFISSSGSRYWYSPEGVVRGADHWGNGVAKCNWALKLKNGRTVYGTTSRDVRCFRQQKFAFARWTDFVHISRILEINGREIMTNFNNYIPRERVAVGGKIYKKVIIETWEPEEE